MVPHRPLPSRAGEEGQPAGPARGQSPAPRPGPPRGRDLRRGRTRRDVGRGCDPAAGCQRAASHGQSAGSAEAVRGDRRGGVGRPPPPFAKQAAESEPVSSSSASALSSRTGWPSRMRFSLRLASPLRYGRRRTTGEDMRPTKLPLAAALGLSLLSCAQQQPTSSPQDLAYCAKLSQLYIDANASSPSMAGGTPDAAG